MITENLIIKLAGEAYTVYCRAVGGKAFDGKPLPPWEDFAQDPQKEKQFLAWLAVAGWHANRVINDVSLVSIEAAARRPEFHALIVAAQDAERALEHMRAGKFQNVRAQLLRALGDLALASPEALAGTGRPALKACASCGEPIEWNPAGNFWFHTQGEKRHPAAPILGTTDRPSNKEKPEQG